MPKILAFSGPDGTGKSTYANMMTKLLKENYIPRRIWIKNAHMLGYLILWLLGKLNPEHVVKSTSGTFVTSSLSNNERLWSWTEFISVVIKLFAVRFFSIMSRFIHAKVYVLIADRYLLDSMVHICISILLSKPSDLKLMQWRIFRLCRCLPFRVLKSLLLKSAITVFLDGEVNVLVRRNTVAGKADPYNYMVLQRYLYLNLVSIMGIPVIYINTTYKSVKEVFVEILTVIKKKAF
ncbi:MAG: hypothetical protein QXF61_02345 [Nitrososphaeria archaeon]